MSLIAARRRRYARGFKANVAGKTGTSRDGWFAGYTPNLVCVVYVGFDDGSQLGLTGADSALPIWADFMTAALNAHPEWGGDWQLPASIQQAVIDTRTGQLASASDPYKRTELLSTAPRPQLPAPRLKTRRRLRRKILRHLLRTTAVTATTNRAVCRRMRLRRLHHLHPLAAAVTHRASKDTASRRPTARPVSKAQSHST
jgi:membrane carboxypeptidase/penicillin-binding protein